MDLGTTFVAAARSDDSQVEMVTLGDRSVVMPAAVYVGEDGELVVGEAADRRASSSPERVARQFKRRLGDPTPMRLGDASYSASDLLAALLREVIARVSVIEGEPPSQVVLTHPANWGPFRRAVFEEVPQAAAVPDALTLTEPEAAAMHYAATRRLDNDELVAVYDLGGGTFDATVVRKVPDGVATLGTPEGVERLGGIDFDQALFEFIDHTADGALTALDMGDPGNVTALARLRQDCVLAKEALSVDTEAVVPVFLPGRHFDVRVTRAEFENMIRAQLESTIIALSRALRTAGVTADELSAVLLVGGSSRIPLVARMVSEELGRPILVDTHPKYAVALGAATPAGRPLTAPAPITTPPPAPASVRSTLLRTGAAALALAGAGALAWTLAAPSSTPPAPPASAAAAPPPPAVLPAPRHLARPKAAAVLVSRSEPVIDVLDGASLSELDAATLAPRWTVALPRPGTSLGELNDESVCVGTGTREGSTECLPVNRATRTVDAAFPLPGEVFATSPVDGGTSVVHLNQDGVLSVMDVRTHAVRSAPLTGWRRETSRSLVGVGGHRAYVVGNVEAPVPMLTTVNLDTMAVTTIPWPPTARPAHPGATSFMRVSPDDDTLYLVTDHDLIGLDAATMRQRFQVPQHAQLAPSVALTPDGRYLYLLTEDGELRVVEAATGRQVSSGHTGRKPTKIFTTDRGRQLLVQTEDGLDLFDTSAFAGA
ncbi:Hsp70 family protein [Pseudonocardia acaciae]|uniref:Hsp70 family protein n=1 Tax=Pseudonocardia acaciae TaxID=551276 RepID=UPI0006876189|nr:Hsp70 family protein [Pseudonocardia acaciae]